jgi:OFA family oxalate/formate antiporter-like MFS transporter
LYAWSIFAVPLGVQFGWDRSALSAVYSVSMIAFCLGSLAGSQITRAFSVKTTLMCTAVLLAVGFAATATFAAVGIWALYLFYGVCAGFGCGIGYNAIVSTVNLWFPDRPGLSAGVLMMGFGLGGLVLGSPAAVAMAHFSWAAVFYAIAISGAVVMIALALVLTLPSDSIAKPTPDSKTKPVNALKTPYFYLYCIWGTIMIALNTTIMGDARAGAETVGADPATATLLVGLMSIVNGVSRVIIGAIYDRTNLKTVMLLASGMGLVTSSGLAVAYALGSPMLYQVAAVLLGFTFGSVPVIASAFVRQAYPVRDFARNLATANFNIATGAIASALIINIARSLGGDVAIYATLAVLVLIAFIDIFIFTARLPHT